MNRHPWLRWKRPESGNHDSIERLHPMPHPNLQIIRNHPRAVTIALITVSLLVLLVCLAIIPFRAEVNTGTTPTSVYIDADDTQDSVRIKAGNPKRWSWLDWYYDARPRTGHYQIQPGESMLDVYRKFQGGTQTPVRVTVPQVRTIDQLASRLARQLMLDSASIATALHDSAYCARLGYTWQTLPALFIPNTYEMWWNTSVDKFMQRMQRENRAFWTEARMEKAQALGMTPVEVVTLASIVSEETAYVPEMPKVAGMYIRRLQIGMPLQADPTVKFALGDFSLRRILFKHLEVNSPYNTYKNKGLPPGPICIPSVKAIDAVLNHEQHGYLYMCAKEDFSGSHNFARTYSEHLANARRYARALDKRGIK